MKAITTHYHGRGSRREHVGWSGLSAEGGSSSVPGLSSSVARRLPLSFCSYVTYKLSRIHLCLCQTKEDNLNDTWRLLITLGKTKQC